MKDRNEGRERFAVHRSDARVAGGSSGLRASVRRARRLARRLEPETPDAPIPPPLPPGRVVEVPGRGEMFVREAAGPPGAPTVVLLHGWTQTADTTWWRVYDGLSAFVSVIAVDHRGHGRGLRSIEPFTLESAADDVAGLLRALGLSEVVAVGYSMGGPITLHLQARHPDLVAGVVLQATALEWSSSWRDRVTWRLMGLVERMLRARSRSVFGRLVRECVEACPDLEPYRPWLLAELGRGEPRTMADAGRALGQFDGRPLAAAVDVPAAVVVMRYDHLVPPSRQRALGRAIPGAAVFELDADHDACLTSPDGFPEVTEAAVRRVLGIVG